METCTLVRHFNAVKFLHPDNAELLKAAQRNLAAFVFGAKPKNDLEKEQLWERLSENQKRAIKNFIVEMEGFHANPS